jgi:hypothetical protein
VGREKRTCHSQIPLHHYLHVHDTRKRMCGQVKDYARFNLDLELQMHVAMLEFGVTTMPPGVTTFIIIADSSNLGVKQISLGLMQVGADTLCCPFVVLPVRRRGLVLSWLLRLLLWTVLAVGSEPHLTFSKERLCYEVESMRVRPKLLLLCRA